MHKHSALVILAISQLAHVAAAAPPGINACTAVPLSELPCTPAEGFERFFVSQSGDGSAPESGNPATAFNIATVVDQASDDLTSVNGFGNWSSTVGAVDVISPGDCVVLIGNLNGQLVPRASGTEQNKITITGRGVASIRNEVPLTGWVENTGGALPIFVLQGLTLPFEVSTIFENGGVPLSSVGTCAGANTEVNVLTEPGQFCRGSNDNNGVNRETRKLAFTPASGMLSAFQSVTGFNGFGDSAYVPLSDPNDVRGAIFFEPGISHFVVRDVFLRRAQTGVMAASAPDGQGGTVGSEDLEIDCVDANNFAGSAFTFVDTKGSITVSNSRAFDAREGIQFYNSAGRENIVRRNLMFNFGLFTLRNGEGINIDSHALGVRGVGNGGAGSFGILVERNNFFFSERVIEFFPGVNGESNLDVIIRRNRIHDAFDGADMLTGPDGPERVACLQMIGMERLEVYYNEFYNCGLDDPANGRVTAGAGVAIGLTGQASEPRIIHNNTFFNVKTAALRSSAGGSGVNDLEFKNNIVSPVGGDDEVLAISFGGSPDNQDELFYSGLDFSNNFYDVRCPSSDPGCDPATVVAFRCLFLASFDEWRDFVSDGTGDCLFDVGDGEDQSLLGDPLFEDVLAFDFDLQVGSTAADLGVALGYTRDIDLDPVPGVPGGVPDAGANERPPAP